MNEEMLTPAQRYKRALTSLSGEERAIIRLEHRWNKNLPKWNKATTYIQKIIRGYIARARVAIIHDKIRIDSLKQKCVAIALESLKQRKFSQAIIDTEEALKLDPESCESYRIRGHAKLALALEIKQKNKISKIKDSPGSVKNAYLDAIFEYSQALKLDELHVQVRLGRARCYLSIGEWKRAEHDIEYLMDIDHKTSLYWRLRGILRSKLCLWEKAADDFSKAISLGDRTSFAYIHRGMAEGSAQLWYEAEKSFTDALRIDESSDAALVLRGRIHCCQRKWDLAEADFKLALAWNPESEGAKKGLETVNIPHIPLPLSET